MRSRHPVIALVALLAVAPAARAQVGAGPVSKADLSASVGWLNADKSGLDSNRGRNDWYNKGLYGGASAGWYWTDHLKTEIEGGVSSDAELRVYTSTVIDGRPASLDSTYRFSTGRVAVGQQYQFYRNVWFHPFVSGGLDLTWERTSRTDEIYASQPLRARTFPTRTELLARPFAAAGFKTYFTPRGFFRTDIKLAFGKGVDEVLVRFGFGVDF
jgi:hypothetical protein